ncbi:thiamine biosynthesis lipoprotein [Saccharicrinis carchari]|uniref:FAD:protein FMN transferase n=1 Tax=Saccharicrinis carchari TaxID=1168039 RepID=A0A521EJX3_SACCC|nr:FAD:protein FMN transferase [Saccharicrinis carchari]SMO84206.1 thiamine biosynthesis lipoprotein [Saccharicrinis carchari]
MKNILIPLIALLFFSCVQTSHDYVKMEGQIFGTYYHVIYQPIQQTDSLDKGLLKVLNKVDWSLSTYKDTSTISKFNFSELGARTDAMLEKVFLKGQEIYDNSDGAFDMTVAPLVNAWGFGFKKKDSITTELIDSLLLFVGMDKLRLKDAFLEKDRPGIMLDASAIAKGFGVDEAANYLLAQGIKNYMVEIGGEIRAAGLNSKGIPWRVGIDQPTDDKTLLSRELQAILSLSDAALATSGNYRNFYIRKGKKYAHTIDPTTGYPVQHSLLSATIIAPDCMSADAYATACMVMGVKKSYQLIKNLPNVEGYFIYVDHNGNNQVKYTPGFESLIAAE